MRMGTYFMDLKMPRSQKRQVYDQCVHTGGQTYYLVAYPEIIGNENAKSEKTRLSRKSNHQSCNTCEKDNKFLEL